MKAFALRHIKTQKWMPCRMFKANPSGWSYWEPEGSGYESRPYDPNPRIFWTIQSARNARSMWAQGRWKKEKTTAGGWDEIPYDVEELVPRKPENPRSSSDLEIVEFDVQILGVKS